MCSLDSVLMEVLSWSSFLGEKRNAEWDSGLIDEIVGMARKVRGFTERPNARRRREVGGMLMQSNPRGTFVVPLGA